MGKQLAILGLVSAVSLGGFAMHQSPRSEPDEEVRAIGVVEIIDEQPEIPSDEVGRLRYELEEMRRSRDFFKSYYVAMVKKNLDEDSKRLDEPLSEISVVDISEIADKYTPVADEPEFAAILQKIATLRTNKATFNKALNLFNGVHGFSLDTPGQINETLAGLKGPLSAAQQKEVDDLKANLGYYADAARLFKAHVEEIVPQMDRENAATSKDYRLSVQRDMLPAFVNQNKFKNDYRYRISKIPYLKRLYDEWMTLISRDFMSPRAIEIEQTVLNFQTDQPAAEPTAPEAQRGEPDPTAPEAQRGDTAPTVPEAQRGEPDPTVPEAQRGETDPTVPEAQRGEDFNP